jgi:hypothetical protein
MVSAFTSYRVKSWEKLQDFVDLFDVNLLKRKGPRRDAKAQEEADFLVREIDFVAPAPSACRPSLVADR